MKNSVQTFLVIAIIFLGSIYTITSLVHYEKQIESLQQELKSCDRGMIFQKEMCFLTVQEMQAKIDSLEKELIFYEPITVDEIINAIISVESSNDDSAYNVKEDAVGCMQIRQTMVDDVNRILKRQGFDHQYVYQDRWCRNKSIQMFDIFCSYYGLTTAEEMARCWNGGPRGINNPATVEYWNKVQDYLDS